MRILLAEDDIDLGYSLKEGLTIHGYHVDWVQDGELALTSLSMPQEHFDLAILDINMPKYSGIEVLNKIRHKNNATPVLILTARDHITDRIQGLDSGADDYMVKPFDLNELCARIRSIARRAESRSNPKLEIGNLILNLARYEATINDKPLSLSRREFTVLHKLIQKSNTVVTRDILSQTLYGWGDDVDSNTIEVHIHNLRKKIAEAANIRTIRGVGYLIEAYKDD